MWLIHFHIRTLHTTIFLRVIHSASIIKADWPGGFYLFIRLGLNIALTHQNMSYRNSKTKENVEAQKREAESVRVGNDRKRTATTKNKHN